MLKLSSDINYNLAPYIMIGCGVFIVLIGFIGCWAAVKEHGWALKLVRERVIQDGRYYTLH